jgi:hypothetical protein
MSLRVTKIRGKGNYYFMAIGPRDCYNGIGIKAFQGVPVGHLAASGRAGIRILGFVKAPAPLGGSQFH